MHRHGIGIVFGGRHTAFFDPAVLGEDFGVMDRFLSVRKFFCGNGLLSLFVSREMKKPVRPPMNQMAGKSTGSRAHAIGRSGNRWKKGERCLCSEETGAQ